MVWTPSYFVQKDGTKTCLYNMIRPTPSGVICLSTVVPEFVLEVSIPMYGNCVGSMTLIWCVPLVDFALTEAAYVVVRLLQSFGNIRLPEGEVVELVGVEKQVTTLVVSIKEGCRVEISQ